MKGLVGIEEGTSGAVKGRHDSHSGECQGGKGREGKGMDVMRKGVVGWSVFPSLASIPL